jgi:hypothetical protein
VNATALLFLSSLNQLVIITEDDVNVVSPSTGTVTPLHMPFPTDGSINSGIATTDGRTIFLLFGQIPDRDRAAHAADGWFVGALDVQAKTLVQGEGVRPLY